MVQNRDGRTGGRLFKRIIAGVSPCFVILSIFIQLFGNVILMRNLLIRGRNAVVLAKVIPAPTGPLDEINPRSR